MTREKKKDRVDKTSLFIQVIEFCFLCYYKLESEQIFVANIRPVCTSGLQSS